jgi:two-component system, response regulator PdtaR
VTKVLRPQIVADGLATERRRAMCHTLIIEDEWIIAELMGDWAEEAGARSVAYASTEDDAVAEALAHPPSFIISDVRLIEGTGPRAVARICDRLGAIPTMFVTGTPNECDPCDDAVAILSKPASSSDVIATFRQFAPI